VVVRHPGECEFGVCVGRKGGKWSLIRSRNGEFHHGIVVSAELG